MLSSQMSGLLRLSYYCYTTSCSLLDFRSAKGNQTKPKSWVICYTFRRLHSQANPSAGTQMFESWDPVWIQTSHQSPPEVSHREFKWTKRLLIHKPLFNNSYRYLLWWKNKCILIGAFAPGAVAVGAVMTAGQRSMVILPHCPGHFMLRERYCRWYGPPEGHIRGCWAHRAQSSPRWRASAQQQPEAPAARGAGSASAGSVSPRAVSLAGRWQDQGSPRAWGSRIGAAQGCSWCTHRGFSMVAAGQRGAALHDTALPETQPSLGGHRALCKERQTSENVHFKAREAIIKCSVIFQIPWEYCFTHQLLLKIYLDVFKLCWP